MLGLRSLAFLFGGVHHLLLQSCCSSCSDNLSAASTSFHLYASNLLFLPCMENFSKDGVLAMPLSRRAISIGFLLNFTWEHDAWFLPTYQVVQNFIIPSTAELKKPYVNLLDPELHGQVKVFISHAWSNPFGLLVAAARKFISDCDSKVSKHDCFFWLDIFAITQHGGLFQAEELAQLEDTVLEADTTLVVLDPSCGIPLQRIWCIFEIFITIEQGTYGKLKVRVGDVSMGGDFLPCNDGEVLRRLAASVNIEGANATVPSDSERILARIATMTSAMESGRKGIKEVDRKLQRAVRQGWT